MRVLFLEIKIRFVECDRCPSVKKGGCRHLSGHPSSTAHSQPRLTDYDWPDHWPGPTDPMRAGLIEIVHQAARLELPTLGICLGHQANRVGVWCSTGSDRSVPRKTLDCDIFRESIISQLSAEVEQSCGITQYPWLGGKSPLNPVCFNKRRIPMANEP